MIANYIQKQICCIIISYNPDHLIYQLVETIKIQVNKIIIVDNNSDKNVQLKLNNLSKQNNISVIFNEKNVGIGKALNQGINLAHELGFLWVLTFDQDSKPYSNILDLLWNVYEMYPDKPNIGAIGINTIKKNLKIYYKVSSSKNYSIKDYLITSGSLLSIDAFNLIGGFREDFFIDNVDLEYSLRLKENGKISLITSECGMEHEAGDAISRRIIGIKVFSSNHNSFRRYYMARNHIILTKDYFLKFPYFILKLNYFFLLSLIKIFLVEKSRKIKIQASLKGIKDGLVYKLKQQ